MGGEPSEVASEIAPEPVMNKISHRSNRLREKLGTYSVERMSLNKSHERSVPLINHSQKMMGPFHKHMQPERYGSPEGYKGGDEFLAKSKMHLLN